MDRKEMQARTKRFALRILTLARALPWKDAGGRAIADQVVRCGTPVGANYRAACRARSRKEFLAKLGVVEEEADETCFWLELIIEGELLKPDRIQPLLEEANELVAIIVATRKTVRATDAA